MNIIIPEPLAFDPGPDWTTGWTLLNIVPPPPVFPITVVSVSPTTFSQEGAVKIVVTLGGIVAAGDIKVFIDGEPCFGGQGYGYTPTTDGSTVAVYTPKLSSSGVVKLTVTQGSALSTELDVAIQERVWRGKQFDIRSSFPPWYSVGARRLSLEAPL